MATGNKHFWKYLQIDLPKCSYRIWQFESRTAERNKHGQVCDIMHGLIVEYRGYQGNRREV
jgi:hypothetical protein